MKNAFAAIGAFANMFLGNFIIQIGMAWVLSYWLAVYAFGGPPVKQGTDWITFVFALILAGKWLPNAVDGVMDQGLEGRGRLAIGFLLVFTYITMSQVWVFYLQRSGETAVMLDNSVTGFLKSIGLAGLIFCVFAETTTVEFTTNRRWYRTAVIGIVCALIGFSIRPFFGF